MGNRPSVLVTRPAGQAAGLCAGLEALGFRAYSQPMLELLPSGPLSEAQKQTLVGLERYQHIIFISGNAVHFGMPLIQAYWPTLPPGPAWYAIGDLTAQRLRKYGLQVTSPGGAMTTETLLATPALEQVAQQRVLIVKGCGGRVSLRTELVARGAQVDELSCYRRQCPAMAPGKLSKMLSQWRIGLILISSGEGLDNMLTLLGHRESEKLMSLPLIVPSARVAEMAKTRGFTVVQTAANASDTAMLRAVENEWLNASDAGE